MNHKTWRPRCRRRENSGRHSPGDSSPVRHSTCPDWSGNPGSCPRSGSTSESGRFGPTGARGFRAWRSGPGNRCRPCARFPSGSRTGPRWQRTSRAGPIRTGPTGRSRHRYCPSRRTAGPRHVPGTARTGSSAGNCCPSPKTTVVDGVLPNPSFSALSVLSASSPTPTNAWNCPSPTNGICRRWRTRNRSFGPGRASAGQHHHQQHHQDRPPTALHAVRPPFRFRAG